MISIGFPASQTPSWGGGPAVPQPRSLPASQPLRPPAGGGKGESRKNKNLVLFVPGQKKQTKTRSYCFVFLDPRRNKKQTQKLLFFASFFSGFSFPPPAGGLRGWEAERVRGWGTAGLPPSWGSGRLENQREIFRKNIGKLRKSKGDHKENEWKAHGIAKKS